MEETLSARQSKFLLASFVFGSTIILGVSTNSKQDAWIGLILSIIIAIPVVLMYARIIKLNQGESFFDISNKLFGKIIGTIINIIVTWYALHLGAMVLCNFEEYIKITTLLNTPAIIITALLLFVVVYIGRSPISTFGKWSTIVSLIIIFVVIVTTTLSITNMHVSHLFPIMEHRFSTILGDSFNNLFFPFAETVLFLCFGNFVKKDDNPYKIYLHSIIFVGIALIIILLRNTMVLGGELMTSVNFPSYATTRVIGIGKFFTRIEGVITINFIFTGITKMAVCLIAASKGISKIINVENYKDLVMPSSLIILMICTILYKNIIQMYDFVKVYSIYAIPFQILIPLAIWIASEIRNKKEKNKATNKLQTA
jgi:spore germination protein KB